MKVIGYDTDRAFDYENGFYLTSDTSRLGKILAQYELYKLVSNLPGAIVECGVFKGASSIRFATFRELFESPWSRKIIGFDAFGDFPRQDIPDDDAFAKHHDQKAGRGISQKELESVLEYKNIRNFEFIAGNINQTVPKYIRERPEMKICLLHIDVDVYEPAKTALNTFYDRVVRGGVITLDDYTAVGGGTRAVDEFFGGMKDIVIRKFPFAHLPCYIIKP